MQPIMFTEEEVSREIRKRDEEWTRAIGSTGKVLTPEEAAKWLEADRRRQLNSVIRESSPRHREVKHY